MRKLLATGLLIFATLLWAQDESPFVYGPVQSGDNLWHAAKAFAEHYDVTPEQAVSLLYQSNMRAFVDGDPNYLMAGAYLALPDSVPLRKAEEPEALPEPAVEPELVVSIESEEEPVEVISEPQLTEAEPTVPAQQHPATLQETVAGMVPPLPEMPEVDDGAQVASLELLMPGLNFAAPLSNAMQSLLGSEGIEFMNFLDGMQRDLAIAQEAIETERRAKDRLEAQLKDLQIQINALTELVALKDQEISSMLQPQLQKFEQTNAPGSGFAAALPGDLLLLLHQAGQNQMVLLLIAVIIAFITMYVWDTISARRAFVAVEQPSSDAVLQSLQNIDTQIALGDYEQAIDRLQQMLARYPQNFNVLYKLCQVYVKDNQQENYRKQLGRIGKKWQHKHPQRWQQLNDLYELAWPMYFSADDGHDDDSYEGDPPSDPIQTKLDLARAYLDIGDHESAAAVLQEVVLEGDAQQKATAQMLLDNIKQ
jgi:FimV-like protein